jgi:hypothetical protein
MSHDARCPLIDQVDEGEEVVVDTRSDYYVTTIWSSPGRMNGLSWRIRDSRPVPVCEIEIERIGSMTSTASQQQHSQSHRQQFGDVWTPEHPVNHRRLLYGRSSWASGIEAQPGEELGEGIPSYKSSKSQLARVRATFSAHEASQTRMMKRRFSALTHQHVFPSSTSLQQVSNASTPKYSDYLTEKEARKDFLF